MDMTIGQVARAAGVHVETIRYYQQCGLLPVPPRPSRSALRGLLRQCDAGGERSCPIIDSFAAPAGAPVRRGKPRASIGAKP